METANPVSVEVVRGTPAPVVPVTATWVSAGDERQSARAAAAAYMARHHPEWQPPTPVRPLPVPMQIGRALVATLVPIASGYDPTRAPESPDRAPSDA